MQYWCHIATRELIAPKGIEAAGDGVRAYVDGVPCDLFPRIDA